MDGIPAILIATFPFIWLSINYIIDYKFEFFEYSFFKKPLEIAIRDQHIIRELCYSNTFSKPCPIFRNLDLCLRSSSHSNIKCTCEPWFASDDLIDPSNFVNKILNATPTEEYYYFLKNQLQLSEKEGLQINLKKNSKQKIILKNFLNRLIRDDFLYKYELFRRSALNLDPYIKFMADIKFAALPPVINQCENLQLNKHILEKAYPLDIKTRLYLNRIWKLMREKCLLCTQQTHLLEFIAVEVLFIYLSKFLIGQTNTWLTVGLVIILIIVSFLWMVTLSKVSPFPIVRKKGLLALTAITLWVFSLLLIY